jgi:hypothetical protein
MLRLLAGSVCALLLMNQIVSSADGRLLHYFQGSNTFPETLFINRDLLNAIELVQFRAKTDGINISGFNQVAIQYDAEQVNVIFLNSGTLDGPKVVATLKRPSLEIVSIK